MTQLLSKSYSISLPKYYANIRIKEHRHKQRSAYYTTTSFPGSTQLSRWRVGAEKTLGHTGEILHESWSILSHDTRSKLVFSTLQRFRPTVQTNGSGIKYDYLIPEPSEPLVKCRENEFQSCVT